MVVLEVYEGVDAVQTKVMSERAATIGADVKSPKAVSAWVVLRETIIKDLRTAVRYRAGLVGGVIELLVRMVFFVFFANVITFEASQIGREMTTTDVFVFFQASLILWIFRGIAVSGPLEAVYRDLYYGTLEFLYTNPSSRYAYYVGSVLSQVLIAQIVFLPLYVILVVVSGAQPINMIMVLVVCLAVFLTLTAMGVMIAGLGLLWRNIDSVAGLTNLAFEFLAGAFFPITVFPKVLQYIAYLLPFTWGYDLVRYYSFNGDWVTILPVWQEWVILLTYAVIFLALSYFFLRKVERMAKRQGLNII